MIPHSVYSSSLKTTLTICCGLLESMLERPKRHCLWSSCATCFNHFFNGECEIRITYKVIRYIKFTNKSTKLKI